ncbi:N-acetyltransferase [Streptomyces longisporoflavus]|uniref:GNAT family N-acetyltransferase n=1 Tax=Streptomyces longisporoflavus TaxID=28044 RepID=UPI00167D23A3|nr:GNAT family N-acetyltransferase [Streptomyces longisporoflavus]GGV52764.1 N-acetyltransferase [Streptomyces longisporoflavus]
MFRIETGVDKERFALLLAGLQASNTAASPVIRSLRGTPQDRESPLAVWLLERTEGLVGGLAGHTWGRWLHVNHLWVSETHQGAGLGAQLLAEAERIARDDRDCLNSRVETWDFQAPGFYRNQGYEVVSVIPDYPEGAKEFTLTKKLA